MKSTMNTTTGNQFYYYRRPSERGSRIDNTKFRKGIDAITSSLNNLGGTLGNAFEETLYNVWETNLELWDSVLRKRIELQQLNLDIKLDMLLREQMAYLEDWALLDGDHCSSVNGVIEDLEASTLRLPVTGGAKVDIDSLKIAISSAADVMQMMGSSICSVLSKAEAIKGLVSELAELAGHERALLSKCDEFLSSSAAAQVKEYSLRTQLIQSQQNASKKRLPLH